MDEILHTNTCSTRITTAERFSKINLNPDPDCPRCKLNNAAPQLLAACEETRDKLIALQGEWSAVQEVYAPEWTHALKELVELLETAIATAS